MKTLFFTFVVLLGVHAQAYILPTKTILQKTVENAGNGVYAIEQEVQFSNGSDSLVLKESWLIENDRTMKLTVNGTKDMQGKIRMQFVYNGGQRTEMNSSGTRSSKKISEDFLEKFFNFRSTDQFANALMRLNIIPSNALNKKRADFKYEPEPFVRLSRVGGAITYALGTPSSADSEKGNPGIWIQQDAFLVRKVRLPSQVEISADNYSQFSRSLSYPRQRTVRWGNNSVNIRLNSITSKTTATNTFQANSVDVQTRLSGLDNLPAKDAVLEFYSRFR